MTAHAGDIAIGIGFDPQTAHDDAVALARAWLAFAVELERTGRVAPSPQTERALRAILRTLGEAPRALDGSHG